MNSPFPPFFVMHALFMISWATLKHYDTMKLSQIKLNLSIKLKDDLSVFLILILNCDLY